jgi:hypothetical protein
MFFDSIISLEDTPHATLRVIAIVATLLKSVPNTYILLSFAGMFLPASYSAAFLTFFSLAPLEGILRHITHLAVSIPANLISHVNLHFNIKHPVHLLK